MFLWTQKCFLFNVILWNINQISNYIVKKLTIQFTNCILITKGRGTSWVVSAIGFPSEVSGVLPALFSLRSSLLLLKMANDRRTEKASGARDPGCTIMLSIAWLILFWSNNANDPQQSILKSMYCFGHSISKINFFNMQHKFVN